MPLSHFGSGTAATILAPSDPISRLACAPVGRGPRMPRIRWSGLQQRSGVAGRARSLWNELSQRLAGQSTHVYPLFPIEGLENVTKGIGVELPEPSCQQVEGEFTGGNRAGATVSRHAGHMSSNESTSSAIGAHGAWSLVCSYGSCRVQPQRCSHAS